MSFRQSIFVYKVLANCVLKSGTILTVLLFLFSENLETLAIYVIAFSVMYKQW